VSNLHLECTLCVFTSKFKVYLIFLIFVLIKFDLNLQLGNPLKNWS
jgi:hypothetical protein